MKKKLFAALGGLVAIVILVVAIMEFRARDEIIEKGLLSDLKTSWPQLDRVEFQLLRQRPTTTGLSVAKYYLWFHAYQGSTLLAEGALRGALDGDDFMVLQMVSRSEIHQNPQVLSKIFPAALIADIEELAKAYSPP